MTDKELMLAAEEARKHSYSPYSGFAVGAALLCGSGKVYTGCNIENASFSPTVCAERVAFFTAVNAGEKAFKSIAVAGGRANEKPQPLCPPCGVCRQVMSEFCDKNFEILIGSSENFEVHTLGDLLPLGFDLK